MTHPKSDAQIRQEARQWLMVLNDADVTEDEKHDFTSWLNQGDREKQAWERATGMWSRLDDLAPALTPTPTKEKPVAANDAGSFRVTRRRMITGAAAAVVGVASGSSYLLTHPEVFADYRTGTRAGKTVTLADGSLVELARSSAISVSWSPQARRITLHDGEALFTARHDPSRPFIVDAGPAVTQTAGAVFDVNRLGDATLVTAVEHELTVKPPRGGIVLTAGRQMRCAPGETLGPLAVDTASILGWRNGRIVADGMRLADLTTELSRYRRGRIFITDSRLRDLPVTAALDARNPDAAIETLAGSLHLRVRHFTPWLVTLSAAS
ncbi:FecR family protein [Gluconacetobacter sp.]|uniref:FecR family protein n=1 Tax=Gluconacetobacter sp. TaxID=1935994 RepID=UPI0039E97532